MDCRGCSAGRPRSHVSILTSFGAVGPLSTLYCTGGALLRCDEEGAYVLFRHCLPTRSRLSSHCHGAPNDGAWFDLLVLRQWWQKGLWTEKKNTPAPNSGGPI